MLQLLFNYKTKGRAAITNFRANRIQLLKHIKLTRQCRLETELPGLYNMTGAACSAPLLLAGHLTTSISTPGQETH